MVNLDIQISRYLGIQYNSNLPWVLAKEKLQFLNQGFLFYFEGFTSIPTALTANDRNRRIQVYQASDG